MEFNNGLPKEKRKEIARELKAVLATSYMLYTKSQKFHWNVKSELFDQLHNSFEEIYQQLAGFNDEVAERIRALGFYYPGSLGNFKKLSEIEESNNKGEEEKKMIETLLADYEVLIRLMRKVSIKADKMEDKATDDLLSAKIREFEKRAWMLRSKLQ